MTALGGELRAQFEAVPPADRKIVSFHDAMPYFARAFGLEIVGSIVSAPGQDPSAGELAALIDAIRASGGRAILSEVQFSDELAQTIAAETGATVVGDLYTDTLGDPPVDTYPGILRWDVDKIVAALR
jgi:zinc/manganese transport system substrate-binding protein/manganese/iron transport system substrate-binding protein